jgi:hypothetical protein
VKEITSGPVCGLPVGRPGRRSFNLGHARLGKFCLVDHYIENGVPGDEYYRYCLVFVAGDSGPAIRTAPGAGGEVEHQVEADRAGQRKAPGGPGARVGGLGHLLVSDRAASISAIRASSVR